LAFTLKIVRSVEEKEKIYTKGSMKVGFIILKLENYIIITGYIRSET